MILKIKEIVINKLLDSYERSKISYDISLLKKRIFIDLRKDDLLSNLYWGDAPRPEVQCEIDENIEELEKEGLVNIEKDSENWITKVYLSLDNIDKSYSFVNRIKKTDIESNWLLKCKDFLKLYKKDSVCFKFLEYLIISLENHKSISKYYLKDYDEIPFILKMINCIENQKDEIYLRQLSINNFSDSKFIEKWETRLLTIFNNFSEIEFEFFRDLADFYNIKIANSLSSIKGGLIFKINNQIINLEDLDEEYYLSKESIDKIEILNVLKTKIVTIENLTTFKVMKEKINDAIVFYTGGFVNSSKKSLLRKIINFYNKIECFHMGDIDVGGFRILNNLKKEVCSNFKALHMGVDELEKYKTNCKELTKFDVKELTKMLDNVEYADYKAVIEFMLKNNIKLEQEVIENI